MANKKFFYFHDCETTGTDPDVHQLLTYGAIVAVFDGENFDVIDTYSLAISYKNYVVDPYALQVNLIDLVEHTVDHRTLSSDRAPALIRDFYTRMRYKIGLDSKLILAGHRVEFDNAFVSKLVPEFETWFEMIPMDTKRIAEFLKLSGKYPSENKTSLVNLAEYFGIPVDNDKLHVSDYDSMLTLKVLEKMVKL